MNIIGLIVASVLENLEEMVFFLINKDIKLTEMRIQDEKYKRNKFIEQKVVAVIHPICPIEE